jgi:hypothetical protein
MGAKHTTDREKQLFQHLVSTGLSVRNVSRLTGRSHACITDNLTDVVPTANQTHMTEEQMFSVFEKDAQNIPCADIARQINKPHSTVYKVIRRIYPKQQRAYAKWLELQKQAEAPVDPVVPPALAAIRAAREAGRIATLNQEESPALVMEVQTVESKPCDCDCNFTDSKICEAMSYSIKNQKAIIANHEETITKQNTTIAELKEINAILKGYVRHLQRLNEQQDRM